MINKLIKIITLSAIFSLFSGIAIYADTTNGSLVVNGPTAVTASTADTVGNASEQYLLTVNKDMGIDTVTVKVGTTTIPPVTPGSNLFWIDKNSNPVISAIPKSGYEITDGTGPAGAINSANTINVTSKTLSTATVNIAYNTHNFLKVTVNGVTVDKDWTGTIKQGDVIKVYANGGAYNQVWYYSSDDRYIGSGAVATCVAPSSSGTGTLSLGYSNTYHPNGYFFIKRIGTCTNWTFNASSE